MTGDEPVTNTSAQGTCTFTADKLDVSGGLPPDFVDWKCSRPVWDETDSDRCVWHAEHADKPPDDLAATIGNGELVGARVRETDLTSVAFPEYSRLMAATLTGATLTGADLRRADLTDANLQSANLSGANLRGTDLTDANLRGTDFTDANLRGTDLTDANLQNATITDADLRHATLTNTDLRHADLTDTKLREATLTDANLTDADPIKADFWKANLTDADLRHANLSGANLQSANLSGVALWGAVFSGADLRNVKLADKKLPYATLAKTDLRHANLSDADLHRANLSDADLRHANLSDADLRHANLSDADLQSAKLGGSNLRQATLDRVGLYETALQNVDIDEGTTARPPSLWERQADAAAELGMFNWSGLRRLRALHRSASDPDKLQRAEQQYRRIERLYREHDLTPNPALAVQEKHARRKRALAEGKPFRWLPLAFSRWVLGYGLLIRPILGVMLVVIVGCTLAYPVLGFEDGSLATGTTETATVTYESIPPPLSWETAQTLGRSLYFSTITFSTLGYADVFPVGWARGLATVESFIGALSMAYLVSVLSRRAIR